MIGVLVTAALYGITAALVAVLIGKAIRNADRPSPPSWRVPDDVAGLERELLP